MAEEWTYDLFVSYVEADKNWVEGYLLDALDNAKIQYTYQSAFALGVPLILEFERAIQQSRKTLLVISESYLGNDLTRFTEILAQSYGQQEGLWQVIPLFLQEGLQLPPRLKMLGEGLKASSLQQWDAAIKRLCDELKLPPPPPPTKPACPYPGMSPFKEEDEQRFFGRDGEIEESLKKLRLDRFLTVIGSSGSGKSSLVFAGLIPKLRQSELFGIGQWCVRSFRPGTSSLPNLQAVLGGDVTAIEVRVEQLLLTQADARRLLLVIDQFEELFTPGGAEVVSFQQTLLKLMEIPNVYLVLTVRADFYPDLMGSLLWKKIRSHRFEVLPLNEEGLKQAIINPAEAVRVYVEPVLVERLLVDAKGEPGVLPLLQETLVLLWGNLKRRFLPLDAYQLLVMSRSDYPTHPRTGLQVAIADRADTTFKQLEMEEKKAIARRIFLRLIQFGEGRPDTRRQQLEDDLRSFEDNSQLFDETLQHLASPTRRLLTFSGEEGTQKRKVDIAHEALISGWPTLQEWIGELREAERTRRRLQEKALEWDRLDKKGGLLDEAELPEAETWLSSNEANVLGYDKSLYDLIKTSREAIESKTRQKKRLIVISFLVLSGFTTAVSILLVITNLQRINARLDARSYSSTVLLNTNKDFDALLEALRAGKELKQTWGVDPDIQTKVIATLQQALYKVKEKNRLEGHRFQVNGVSVSPDGQTIASASDDSTVRIWNLDGSFKELKRPTSEVGKDNEECENCFYSVTFDPNSNNKTLVVGERNGKLLLWKDYNFIRSINAHRERVLSVSFNRQGTILASASQDKTIKLWELNNDKEVKTLTGHSDQVNSISFNSAGTLLGSASADGTIRLWNMATGQFTTPFKGYDKPGFKKQIFSVSFNPDGSLLASGHQDGTIKLWHLNGKLIKTFSGHKDQLNCVQFSPDGKTLASASKDRTIKLWNLNGTLIETLYGHNDSVNTLSFNQDGKTLVSGSTDNTVKIWSLPNKLPEISRNLKEPFMSTSFSDDGRFVAVTADVNTVQLWDLKDNSSKILEGQDDVINSAASSSDGQFLATAENSINLGKNQQNIAGEKHLIKLWKLDGSFILQKIFSGHTSYVERVIFSPVELLLASSSQDKTVRRWSFDGRELPPLVGHTKSVTSVTFSPDGQFIASTSKDNTAKLWRNSDGKEIATLKGHGDRVNAISFSPDGNLLASASSDSTVKLWNRDGKELQTLKGHIGGVNSVDISPNARIIASVGEDELVRLWSLNGLEIKALQGHRVQILGVKFTVDRKRLISFGADGSLIIWDIDLDNLQRQGCRWVDNYLHSNPLVSSNDHRLCDNITY